MIFVGLFLIPIALLIIFLLRKFNTGRKVKILLNIFLIAISIIYLFLCLSLNTEPFNYDIQQAKDVFIYSAVILIFSPFLWVVLVHYCLLLFRNMRIRKNTKIKSNSEYMYYRDDLNKISPGIIMFISMMDIDVKKSVSAIILKFQLLGFVEEKNNKLVTTGKDSVGLLESEKMVLSSISGGTFHEKAYRELVKKEALDHKYIRRNSHLMIVKILKMLITIILPVIIYTLSVKLDNYVFENYHIYKENDGITYVHLSSDEEIEKLYDQVTDPDDYSHRQIEVFGKKSITYNFSQIRADRLNYGVVRYAQFLNIATPLSIFLTIVLFFVSVFKLFYQIVFFNKNYSRTAEGNKLLNKAYALKNYLKDFSVISTRTREELILWDYYMIYAVILDVNTTIENELVESYLKDLHVIS